MNPLNSPLEVGIRILVILSEVFPDNLDLSQLVYYDHALLHSADLSGPASLHPEIPARPGELGIKRGLIQDGIQVLERAGLVELQAGSTGITYRATERSPGFVGLLESPYVANLRERAQWVANEIHPLEPRELRLAMARVFEKWSEEFEVGVRRRLSDGSGES